MALATATWYATPTIEGSMLSFAGIWYGYLSLPLFQFLLLRWYFRLFIWTRFLWQVSRIELSLVPTHPDRVGGLGFLTMTVYAFTPLVVAHGVLLAGLISNRIFYVGATLPQFIVQIAVLVVFLLCLVLGPLLVFAPQLALAKRTGEREYGTLAERYARESDMANSFEVVRTIRIVPITKEVVLQVVVATLAPVVPLVLTMMSLEELLKALWGTLF
jgi:hypothetical protein